MSKTATVIFGGSFNPIHRGHLSLACEVCRHGLANEVWFMVSPRNPHKAECDILHEAHRLRMVELATEGHERFRACDFEFSLPRPSYTATTLEELRKAFPEREFVLLIGADNWNNFHKWHKWEEIIARYRIIVYPRGEGCVPYLPDRVMWLNAPLCDVSSTQVRAMAAKGEDISPLVPPAVYRYIKENNLYKKP